MILSDLLHSSVHDSSGIEVGRVVDARFVIDGAPHQLLADARLEGLIVSPHSGSSFLGFERTDANAPWPIVALLRWRHRGAFLVAWSDIAVIDTERVELRPGFERLPVTLPSYRNG
jgi:sporulation protein YlmC with PRC-barrel domain